MKDRLTLILAVVMVALAVFVTVQLIDSAAAQKGRVQPTQTPVSEQVDDVKLWPACEDTAPGEACQMYDDFDGDGTNTVGYFPRGM